MSKYEELRQLKKDLASQKIELEAELKDELKTTGNDIKKWIVIGGSLLISYSLLKLIIKPDKSSNDKSEGSGFSSTLKKQAMTVLLILAREKLVKALKDKI